MPRGDRTGPNGFGPMTGRGAGFCNGYQNPGFMGRGYGRGAGMRRGGMGYGRGFSRGWGAVPYETMPPVQNADAMKREAEYLEGELKALREEISRLEDAGEK